MNNPPEVMVIPDIWINGLQIWYESVQQMSFIKLMTGNWFYNMAEPGHYGGTQNAREKYRQNLHIWILFKSLGYRNLNKFLASKSI